MAPQRFAVVLADPVAECFHLVGFSSTERGAKIMATKATNRATFGVADVYDAQDVAEVNGKTILSDYPVWVSDRGRWLFAGKMGYLANYKIGPDLFI